MVGVSDQALYRVQQTGSFPLTHWISPSVAESALISLNDPVRRDKFVIVEQIVLKVDLYRLDCPRFVLNEL